MPLVPVDLDPYYQDQIDDGLPKPLVHKTDHVQEGKARLISQYVDKPRIVTLLGIYLKQIQDLEDAGWSILEGYDLNNATNAQLKVLGRIVGAEPADLNDENFRTLIRARIKALRSNGKPNELIAILALASADTAETPPVILYREFTPPGIEIQLQTQIGSISADVIDDLLQMAKAGGVRLLFCYTSATRATTTRFGSWTGSRAFSAPIGLGSSVTPGGAGLAAGARVG